MKRKISLFLVVFFCLFLFILPEEKITSNHNRSFFGFNYQLEFGEYLIEPVKFYGVSIVYDYKPRYKIGWKLEIVKENSWLGDGWELVFIPRRYLPFEQNPDTLSGIIGLGVAYKIPSRLYYSYNAELKEHIYVREKQLLGMRKSLVAEFGLRGKSFGRVYFETSLMIKPLNFFVKDRNRFNIFVGANLSLLYCVRK